MHAAQHFGVVKRTYPMTLPEVTATAAPCIARAACAGNDERFNGAELAADRARAISAPLVDLARSTARAVNVAVATWRTQQLARATTRALAALDARALRDIGLHRSELASVGAEVAGLIERHRVHELRSTKGNSR